MITTYCEKTRTPTPIVTEIVDDFGTLIDFEYIPAPLYSDMLEQALHYLSGVFHFEPSEWLEWDQSI